MGVIFVRTRVGRSYVAEKFTDGRRGRKAVL